VTGKERIAQVLIAQGVPVGTELALRPIRLVVSDDNSSVLTYGLARWTLPDSTRGEEGIYLASWHRAGTAWRLGAFGLTNMLERGTPAWPPDLASPRGEEVVTLSGGRGRPFVLTDLAFADSASRSTASTAFGHWAAPDAVNFDAAGIMNIGPAAISQALAGLDSANWRWAPVAGGSAEDGSIGWTAGEATITVPATDQRPEQVIRSTYLSLWQRQPDGSIKFIADGGGSRP
jgi:hypothetical protein